MRVSAASASGPSNANLWSAASWNSFLPVLDNFALALKSKGSEEQLRSGVDLIVKQMEEILQKMQVIAVPTVGEAFESACYA